MKAPHEEFVSELTNCQNDLFGYLTGLLGNVHDARDVLQETNLVMWRRMETFTPGTNFVAWARKCAYFQALAFLRDRKRGPSFLREDILELIASEDDGPIREENENSLALRDCLAGLSEPHRRLLKLRYQDGTPLRDLAAQEHKSESAMKMILMRLREALQTCIESRLRESTS